MNDKKRIEFSYLREARRASSVLPSGEPVPNDPLDFLFPGTTGTLGIEVTELCRQDERFKGARLGYVAPKAKALYSKRSGAKPVNVSPVFSDDAEDIHVDELARGLADFVYANQDANRNISWHECRDLPSGYIQIGVFAPFDFEPEGNWRYFRGFSVERASRELIAGRIAEKNARMALYRQAASEVWLLIVNDRFLGPGEVWVRADELAQWTFDFAFDKVLLFERQPGGTGDVIELRRN